MLQVTPPSVQSVCVYCGSSSHVDPRYIDIAREVGSALGRRKIRVVYGGGSRGLMGPLADSALQGGGEVIGVIPEYIRDREVQHDHLTQLHVVDSMHTRKMKMFELSDAFAALPGGLGTLEEIFEIMTWKQLGMHTKPVILYNKYGFWDSLLAMMDQLAEKKFTLRETLTSFTVANSVDGLFAALAAPVYPAMDPIAKWF